MRRWSWPLGLLVLPALLLLAVLLPSGCSRRHPVAPTPKLPSEIIFSHAKHLEEAECDSCHEGVAEATTLKARHGPTKETCGECHEEELEDKARCKMCHENVAVARKLPRVPSTARLHFSHESHLGRIKAEGADKCKVCHAPVMQAKDLDSVTRPEMPDCWSSCHNHRDDYRSLRCRKCHQSLSQYPIKFVSTFNHEGNFLAEHGRWAHSQADVCGMCHQQSYCADCHSQRSVVVPSLKWAEKADRQFIHRGDWLSRHPVASRADPQQCTRCHSSKSCQSCHNSWGVSGAAQAGPGGTGRSPHPPGWLNPASPNNHGVEARRRITQCASCHDRGAKSNCVECHRSRTRGGLGINPHPPGWDREEKGSKKMCQFCH